jgi:hypothetical protein
MKRLFVLPSFAQAAILLAACDSTDSVEPGSAPADAAISDAAPADAASADAAPDEDAGDDGAGENTVLDLDDVKTNPDDYEWFDFRPNVKKLILSGAAETEHIAILWYTTDDGGVGLHYHGKTESVYVVDGTQTDAKGMYPTGNVYFNPPGSGHEITDSSGFFLLSYAAPPDFMGTDMIEEYEPIRIDAKDPELTSTYEFDEVADGISVFEPELVASGGMSAQLIETTSPEDYDFEGNYLLVLRGRCEIEGEGYAEDMLVVAKTVEPKAYKIAAIDDETCLAMGISF